MASKKTSKPRRPRAETPRGFRDSFGPEVAARNTMLARICAVYASYGFDPLESPAIETVEALGKFLPDVDRPNEGVFAWDDPDEGWLALRYDLTAPLARVFAQHRRDLPNPYRRYAVGPVWRNEKPGPGRFRQFTQCDADTVGAASVAADAEMCMMLGEALEAVGIAPADFLIRVNNRKVLNGVMETAGLLDPADPEAGAARRGIVLRAIDKFDRLGAEGVRALMGPGRRDESGDVTEGAGLSPDQIAIVLAFFEASKTSQTIDPEGLVPSMSARGIFDPNITITALSNLVGNSSEGRKGLNEMEIILELTSNQNGGQNSIVFDTSVVRGLGYYTGPVYEAELTFEIRDEKGRKRQFGSVAGGGRYDDLVKRFTGETVPATGISIGVDRLLAALDAKGRGPAPSAGPVVVTVMDRDNMAAYQAMAAELRAAGIRAEVFLGSGNMAKQLKYSDQRDAPVAIIEGADERARGIVQLKDLALGARLAADIETNEDWKAQPAQMEVSRTDLVTQVRAMLARAAG